MVEDRPSHGDGTVVCRAHRSTMRVVHRIRCDNVAVGVAIQFDSSLQLSPITVEQIPSGGLVVVQRFPVEVEHVRTGVGEAPRNVSGEPDDHTGKSGNRNPINVHLSGDRQVNFVPNRRQCEFQMWIAAQQRVSARRARRRHRPVVACPRRTAPPGGIGRQHLFGEHRNVRSVGPRLGRRRQLGEVEAGLGRRVGLDRLDDGVVQGKQGVGSRLAHQGFNRGAPQLLRIVGQGVPHAFVEQHAVEQLPPSRRGVQEVVFERQV